MGGGRRGGVAWLVLVASCGATGEGAAIDGVHRGEMALRPDHPSSTDMFRFDSGDVVESFDSAGGDFRLHFARAGDHAVPSADVAGNGVPDFVEEAAGAYDAVLAFYRDTLGFRAPLSDSSLSDNGGDERFDVYFIDFAGNADGAFRLDGCLTTSDRCIGYMVQENDFVGYGYPSTAVANRVLASHEFFHAVQAAYDADQGGILSEGTATWASEQFDPSLNDLEAAVDGYLDNPDRSLDKPLGGPVDPFSYGSALFFQFVGEAFGVEVVRAIVEASEDGAGGVADPLWFEQLEAVFAAQLGTTFAEVMIEFSHWNLYTNNRANPALSYAGGASYPRVRIDPVSAPFSDDAPRFFYAASQYWGLAPAGRSQMGAALVGAASDLADLHLFLVVERAGAYEVPVRVTDPGAATAVVDTDGASQLVVLVVNTAQSGQSRRPGVCIGTAEEMAACKTALLPAPPIDEGADDDGCMAVEPQASALFALGLLLWGNRRRAAATRST